MNTDSARRHGRLPFRHNGETLRLYAGLSGGFFGDAVGQDSVENYADKFTRNFSGIPGSLFFLRDNIITLLSFAAPPAAGLLFDGGTGKSDAVSRLFGFIPLPFAISALCVFTVPSADRRINFLWSLLSGVVFCVSDTFYDVALSAFSLRLTSARPDGRMIFTVETLASSLGSLLSGCLIPFAAGRFSASADVRSAYFRILLLLTAAALPLMLAPLPAVKRTPLPTRQKEETADDRSAAFRLLRYNRPFAVLAAATVTEIPRQIAGKLLPFLYDEVLGSYRLKAASDALGGVLSYAALAGVPIAERKLPADRLLAAGYGFSAFFYAVLLLLAHRKSPGELRSRRLLPGLCAGLVSVPFPAQNALKRLLLADCADCAERLSMQKYGAPLRADGLISAAQSITVKGSQLIRNNLYDLSFPLLGFDPGADVSGKNRRNDNVLPRLYCVIALCGIAGNLLPALCLLFGNKRKRKRAAHPGGPGAAQRER